MIVDAKTSDDEHRGKQFKAFVLSAFTAETNTQAEAGGNKERDKMIVEAMGGLDEPRGGAEVDGGSVWRNRAQWIWEKISCDVCFDSR